MAKNNKFRLAEQFIEDLQVALQSEADYYSEGSEDVVAEYKKRHCNNLENFEERGHYYSSMPYERHSTKPVWSKRALFPLSKVFPIKCAELNNRKHPFQKLIDKHPSYNNALSTFRRKLIFIPMNHRYTKQEVSPISLDVMLDHFLAKAILAWDGFQISNFEKYVFSSKTEMESIERKAQELFKAIDAAHDNIKRSIKPDAIKCIESLAHGYDGKAIENVIPIKLRETEQDWKHKRNIKLKNIHSSYDRVAPKINHNKSGKEILMRILVSDYRYKFGVYDLIRIPKGIKSNVDYGKRVNVSRYNIDALKGKKIDGKCWAERDKDVIHADVLVDLVAVIDDAFMNESQRSISRYASGQKEVDDELRDGFCTQIYSTRCHRSMKYVIPCHD